MTTTSLIVYLMLFYILFIFRFSSKTPFSKNNSFWFAMKTEVELLLKCKWFELILFYFIYLCHFLLVISPLFHVCSLTYTLGDYWSIWTNRSIKESDYKLALNAPVFSVNPFNLPSFVDEKYSIYSSIIS